MKYGYTIALASLLAASAPVGAAQTDQSLLSYKDLVREARRYEKLEGSERAPSAKILFRKVRLDLKPFAAPGRGRRTTRLRCNGRPAAR